MSHQCHAHACTAVIAPKLFMCRLHWYRLRKAMRDAIWREYRPGQEIDKSPSARYMAVQRRAVGEVAFGSATPGDAAYYLLKSEEWRARAIAQGLGDPLEGLAAVQS